VRNFANLAEFARQWAKRARRPAIREEPAAGREYLTAETIAAIRAVEARRREREDAPFELLPENLPIVETFYRVSNCWRYGSTGGILGLDWLQLSAKLQLLKVEPGQEIIAGLETIEKAAIGVLNG
jgi:hypothetical protein